MCMTRKLIDPVCSLQWSTETIIETETLCQPSAHTSAGVAAVECDTSSNDSNEGERHSAQGAAGFTRRKARTELCQPSAHTSAGVAAVECDTSSNEGEHHSAQGAASFTRRKARTESTVEMSRGVGGCGRGF